MPRRRRFSSPLATAVVGLALVLLMLLPGSLARGVRMFAWGIVGSVQRVILGLFGGGPGGDGAREMERLRTENLLLKENEEKAARLEALLELKEEFPLRLVAARVIGRDATFWSGTVMIDSGLDKGFRPGLGVISPMGVVGHIVETYGRSSKILLLTDASSRIDAYVSRTGDEGIVEGKGGKLSRLKYVSSDAEVEVGDAVVTGGLDGIFPQGLPIGAVTMVSREKYALFQEAEILPAARLHSLREVLVILPEARRPGGR